MDSMLMPKIGYQPSFPATKYRKNEDLYSAIERIIVGDLSLDQNSFYLKTELWILTNHPALNYPMKHGKIPVCLVIARNAGQR